ncbi:hypothetical protein BamIOP4010DRAFT_0609 [Burkholderia ambifaria IOP40-10]|uniref:Transmembrane protein n=1 Tax=Burkholderia ambifaria IOP40-10 TaxID=396596 RepID=B1F9A0_9BURK|nr:hypothetical protein [Burkholderia ambifaria]EDT05872.1 hypothetical protein BamIOP4010DRAFT_0609 [Burkholderia ambifaria IOP40-10]
MQNNLGQPLHGRSIHRVATAIWIALTLLFELGWAALVYAVPEFVPDVQVPMYMLLGIAGTLVAVALAGFAAIPLLVLIAVDEAFVRLCTAKERA